MDLNEYFVSCCRKTGVQLSNCTPSFKPILQGRKEQNKNGVAASFGFDGFTLKIYYFEHAKAASQQILWISFVLDCEPSIPFSLYDILTFTDPENFNCYTYSYVDSEELMKNCFDEINAVLKDTVVKLQSVLNDGVKRNKLIIAQRECISAYFGDETLLQNSEMLGNTAEKLISMLIFNFFEYEIDDILIGNSALFFAGKTQKALNRLRKSKYKTLHNQALLAYLENGGSCPPQSETVIKASADKGLKRHGGGIKSAFIMVGVALLCTIPVSLITLATYFLFTRFLTIGSLFVLGMEEAVQFIVPFSFIASIPVAGQVLRFAEKRRGKQKSGIKPPAETSATKKFYKYFTIFAETLILLIAFIGFNMTIIFENDSFLYSESDFPLSHKTCEYSAIDRVIFTDGYYFDGDYIDSPAITVYTKSGTKIDLSDTTYLSADKYEKELTNFFTDKNITVKHFKTTDDEK